MSDRIAVMNAGRIEQIGEPADIYERSGNALRRRVHRPDELLSPDMVTAPAVRSEPREEGSSLAVPVRSGSRTARSSRCGEARALPLCSRKAGCRPRPQRYRPAGALPSARRREFHLDLERWRARPRGDAERR
jgi:ABC-type sugar transport system ATPase subunit